MKQIEKDVKDKVKKEIKKKVNKKFKKQKGAVMKFLVKVVAKLVWKVAVFGSVVSGIILLLNKFAPDVLDNLNQYLKELREDDQLRKYMS